MSGEFDGQERTPCLDGRAKERVGLIELAEPFVDAAERLVQLRLDERLAIERARVEHAAVDERDDTKVVGRAGLLLAAIEEPKHEALNTIRSRGLRHCRVSRGGEPHRIEADEADDEAQHNGAGQRRPPVAVNELSEPDSRCVSGLASSGSLAR